MTTLFPDSETFVKDRPTKLTPNQEKELYRSLAKDMKAHGFAAEYQDEESIIKDLKSLSSWQDGYEKAKDLERKGYEINTEFVQWLDDIEYDRRSLLRSTVTQWVEAHSITPGYEKGQKLQATGVVHGYHEEGDVLFITSINRKSATYCIDKNPENNGGLVRTYEDIEENYIKL